MGKQTTIKDVARISGVSFATVARVINGNYPVSASTKEKVEKAIKESGYRKNALAQSLKTNKTKQISLIIEDMSNQFFMEIAKGIENIISKDDYILVMASSDGDSNRERKIVDNFLSRRVDGIIIVSTDTDLKSLKNYIDSKIPFLVVDRPIDSNMCNICSMVVWENEHTAYTLTKMLIEHGHRDIGIVNASLKNINSKERLLGFTKALNDYNIPVKEKNVSNANYTMEDAYSWVRKLLAGKEIPNALFCANNIMAKGTIKAIFDEGLRIPDDISVVSFGKLEWNNLLNPGITTADQDGFQMGIQSGMLIKQEIENKNNVNSRIILNPVIIDRGSIKKK